MVNGLFKCWQIFTLWIKPYTCFHLVLILWIFVTLHSFSMRLKIPCLSYKMVQIISFPSKLNILSFECNKCHFVEWDRVNFDLFHFQIMTAWHFKISEILIFRLKFQVIWWQVNEQLVPQCHMCQSRLCWPWWWIRYF